VAISFRVVTQINIRVCEEHFDMACLQGYFLKQLQQCSFLGTNTQRGNATTTIVTFHTGLTVQCYSRGIICAPSRECCEALSSYRSDFLCGTFISPMEQYSPSEASGWSTNRELTRPSCTRASKVVCFLQSSRGI
jgi:hypothetical protein